MWLTAAVICLLVTQAAQAFDLGVKGTSCNTDPAKGEVNDPCASLYGAICGGSFCKCPSGTHEDKGLKRCVRGAAPSSGGGDLFDDLPLDYVPGKGKEERNKTKTKVPVTQKPDVSVPSETKGQPQPPYVPPAPGVHPAQPQPGGYPSQPGQSGGYYPNQPGNYPNQPGYNPNQPGYYPNQPGYNPNQPGYYPNQPGYNPNQPGYYPNKPGYNPNQPGYYPNQPGYNPNQPGYPKQPGYSPGQPGYYPNQPGYYPDPSGGKHGRKVPTQPGYDPHLGEKAGGGVGGGIGLLLLIGLVYFCCCRGGKGKNLMSKLPFFPGGRGGQAAPGGMYAMQQASGNVEAGGQQLYVPSNQSQPDNAAPSQQAPVGFEGQDPPPPYTEKAQPL